MTHNMEEYIAPVKGRYRGELTVALRAVMDVGDLQLESFGERIAAVRKEDRSPVTMVDRRSERRIREILAAAFPADGVLGEEEERAAGDGNRLWVIDPIDGTRPFMRGIPTFGSLLALMEEDLPVLGVMHFPALHQTVYAVRNGGAYLNGTPLHVSSTAALSEATGTGFGYIQRFTEKEGTGLLSSMRTWDYALGFMDAYTYASVAAGRIDVAVNLLDRPWDCAAAAAIITEAGGTWSDINGLASIYNGTFVCSNGLLHRALLDSLVS